MPQDEFEIKVKKVLTAKYRLGLTSEQKIEMGSIRSDLNNYQAKTFLKLLSKLKINKICNLKLDFDFGKSEI